MPKAEVIFPSSDLDLGQDAHYFLFDDGNVAEIGRSVGVQLIRAENSADKDRTFTVEDISDASRLQLENLGATVRLLDAA